MLESLGLGEAPSQDEADVARLQHLHDPREAGHEARRLPRRRGRAEAREPGAASIAVGGCYAEAQRERIFELYPQVDVAFGPGSIPHLGEWLGAGGDAPRGRFGTARALRRRPADAPRARVPGLGAGLDGLQLEVLVLHRPGGARPRAEPPAGRDRRRGHAARRRRRPGGDAARPERELLGPRPRARPRAPSSASCCAPATRSTGSSGSASRARTRRTSASR